MQRALHASLVLGAAVTLLLAPVKLCLLATLFHVPCPGCGMTRAALALVHGDLANAFALHPLSPVIAPWMAWTVGIHVIAYVREGTSMPGRPAAFAAPDAHSPRRAASDGGLPARSARTWWALEGTLAAAAVILLVLLWGARFFGYFGGPVPV